MPDGRCLQTVGFDSTSYWVLQAQPCSAAQLSQRFIVKDSLRSASGSRVESLTAGGRCLSYSLGERLARPCSGWGWALAG
jgi:hypothetical protein